jgi:saccharopine dehydrogenase-like NADP-dependent oxidoreductase
MPLRVVLIGATGVFGSLLARRLAFDIRLALILAGRRKSHLEFLRDKLGDNSVVVAELDVDRASLPDELATLKPQLVIHTAGPFQGENYHIAEACLACGSDYIDLADGRDFVIGIQALESRAKQAGRLLVTGVSTVPALSSAVVDALRPRFRMLESIEHAINPGNQTPRGDATVASILGYCGKPIRIWRHGRWTYAYGWMSGKRQIFPFGRRRVGVCEIPDLDLFPASYPEVRSVVFRAGLELPVLHVATGCAAMLVRLGLIRDLAAHAPALRRLSERFIRFGSQTGGMVVELSGIGLDGEPLRLRWWLKAESGDGSQVPVTPAVVLAQRLAEGRVSATGAQPCMGLLTLAQIEAGFEGYAIRCGVDTLS